MIAPQSSALSRLVEVFRHPFPIVADLPETALKTALAFGAFVAFFLNLYPPFGLGTLPRPEFYIHTFGYGLVCSVVLLVNFFVSPRLLSKIFDENHWTVGRHIIFTLFNISCVTLGNITYTAVMFGMNISFYSVLRFLWITLLIGAFPVVILTFVQERRYLRRNINTADKIAAQLHEQQADASANSDIRRTTTDNALSQQSRNNETSSKISQISEKEGNKQVQAPLVFEGASNKERFEANVERILCLQANDNYVTIFAFSDESKTAVASALLRMTLKYAEERVSPYSQLIRCHKSYIVNLQYVEDIAGNAQGYKLRISALDFPVPVSRSYQERMLNAFQENYHRLKNTLDSARSKIQTL